MDFSQYWQHTDAVSITLFVVLIVLSIASWITGIMRIIASKNMANTIVPKMNQFIELHYNDFKDSDFAQKKTATEQLLLQKIARIRFDLEKGLMVLGTTAAIAPFIGLFGTVWGIFHALHRIGATGLAGLAEVAGPVGEALIMTGLGLAVAIPAVIFYNLAIRMNKKVMHIANDTAHEILAKAAL